jgi:hypothetical protein
MIFDLKFIGLLEEKLDNREESVEAETLEQAIEIVKSKYRLVQRIKYNGLYVS